MTTGPSPRCTKRSATPRSRMRSSTRICAPPASPRLRARTPPTPSATWSRPGGLLAAPQVADELDRERDRKRDAEAEREALPRALLERLAADVADQRRVGAPRQRRDRVEERERAQPVRDRAGGQRDG